MLKLREAWQKSRRIKKACRIGRQSCGRHGRSPKGARNRGGLDVKAAGKQEEVQSGRVNPGRLYIMSKNKGDELKL